MQSPNNRSSKLIARGTSVESTESTAGNRFEQPEYGKGLKAAFKSFGEMDMQEIFKQMEVNVKNVLNLKEINHYYTLIKDESLRNENQIQINDLSTKVMSTL